MRVVLALNGISPCGEVVKAAAARPWPSGSSFCLLNVLDPYPFVRAPLLLERAKAHVRENLERQAGRLLNVGGTVTTEIVWAVPAGGSMLLPEIGRLIWSWLAQTNSGTGSV